MNNVSCNIPSPATKFVWALFLSCALLAFGCVVTACDVWPAGRPLPVLEEGQKYELSLLDTEACPLPAGLDPDKVTIVSYKVRLRSADERGVPSNYFYASLLCSDGSRYLADHEGCSPLLSGPPLYAGDLSEGYLNFPIPRSKTPETLVYAPELIGSSSAPQEIPVSSNSEGPSSDDLPEAQ